ncbi:MAG: glutamate racemase [Coriobacteriia bacterium]|nr:glutamate racemase [Coriobacteriia bacterium]MCL2870126.1 glutamate racemase [Coriobacteriia bacterium]
MNNDAAIGIFDSGLGGLTVAKEIARLMPHESLVYVGDQARCPYGSREPSEIQEFVSQITNFLAGQRVKAIVIACNTATSCGLELAQSLVDIPVIGVIESGVSAALEATHNDCVAVIGTQHTIDSGAYLRTIRQQNSDIKVVGRATPEFATIVESGLEDKMLQSVQNQGEYYQLIEGYVRPLLEHSPDTLLLGCTHYPILAEALRIVVGPEVTIVSSAAKVAEELKYVLRDYSQLAGTEAKASHTFYTTGGKLENFTQSGFRIFGAELDRVHHLDLEELTL